MALDLSDLDAFEASYKPRAKKNTAPASLALDDLDAFEAEYAARLEAEKAEKQRTEKIAAKNSAEAPLSIPQVPVGVLGTWGGMVRAGEMEQARVSARVDDGKGNNVLNVVPQGVGSAAASAAGGAGASADTLLNAPRAAAEAVLPEEWYRKLYGTAPGVPFDAATRAGADVADALRVTTDAEFPMPQANRRWKAEDAAVKAAGGGLVEEVMTGLRNPVGVAQEALKMGVEFGTVARATGVLGGTALMEGGATDVAAAEFDRQWDEGTVQQSAAYQELAAELGPEAAREALKSKRMQLTAQLGALMGVAGAKVSGKFGGQKIEEFLSGKADEAIPFTQVPLQAAMEGAEEVPVQIGTNIAAQWTGDPERDATAGAGSAFVQGALVGGTTAGGISGIQSGVEFARQMLDELRGTSVGKPDVTPPKTPSVSTGDIDSNIEGSISSVDIASDTVSNIVDQKKDVTLAEGVPSIAQESAPVNTPSEIDTKIADLRARGARYADPVAYVDEYVNDPGTDDVVDSLVSEARVVERAIADRLGVKVSELGDHEDRMTQAERDFLFYAEDVVDAETRSKLRRVSAGISDAEDAAAELRGLFSTLPTVVDAAQAPTYSREVLGKAKFIISRATELGLDGTALLQDAVGRYVRNLDDPQDQEFLARNAMQAFADVLQKPEAQAVQNVPRLPAPPVTRSEPPATAPATTLPTPVQNTAVAPPAQPQTAPEVAPSVASTTLAPTPIPAPTNTQSTVAPKTPPSPRDFRLQATQEIQAKVASDPAYRKRVTADTNLFNTDVLARAAELKAASAPTPAPAAPADVVPAQSPATPSNIDAPDTGGTGKVSPLRSAQNGRAIMNMVSQGTAPASSLARRVASDLKTSPTVQTVEVVWATEAEAQTPGHPLYRGTNEDGSLNTADGMYDEKTNKVHLVETVTAEAALHEVAHAATARAMIDVESGVNTDQKAVQALDDLKRATTDLGNVDTSNMPKWVADRIEYAARNPLEAVAILRSNPAVVAALNAGGVKTEVQRTRAVTTEQSLRPWKKFVNALARFVNVTVFPTKTVTEIQTYVEKMLTGDAVIAASKTFEGIDARSSNMRTPESRAARDRLLKDTGTGKTNWTAPKAEATMDAPPIQQDQLVTPREKGAMGIANRLIDTAIMGLTPKGRASKVTQLAVEQQTGIEAEYRLETELATYEMEQAFSEAVKTLPQRTKELYRGNMMKRLAGDKSVELPERTKKAVDAIRALIDGRTSLLIALGAVPAKETKKLLRNIGSWLHNDYQKTRMSPAQFLRKVQDWSAGGRDVIADMLPDLMADMALPDEAGLDTLFKQTESKDKKEKDTAEKILRMYAEQWGLGANTPLEGKDGVVDRLKDLTKADPAKMRATAIDYANRLLDPKRTTLDTNPAGVFSRITGAIKSRMNIDDSALDQKRTKMPKWLQTLYGKYSDPAAVAIISLGEQGRILAKFRALWDFRETGLREGILKENVAGTDAESMGKQGYELLTNHQQLHYGPLENMWIKSEDKWLMDMSATMEFVGFSKDPARYLAGYMHQNTSGPGAAAATVGMGVIAAVQPVGRAFKISQVLLDHTAAITNMGGSAIFLSGGLTAPGSWGKAAAGARFSSFAGTMAGSNARKDQITEDVKFLTRMTVLQNASLSADIRSDLIDRVDQEMEQYLPGARRAYIKTGRGLRRVVDFAARINSAGDEFSKMLMWYARMPHLAAIHPDKTEDEIRELAAEEVLQTTANWHREAPIAKALGNTMVVAPFIVFQAGMIRSSYNSLGLVAKYSAMAKDGNVAAGKYAAMEFGHFVLRVAGASALNTVLLKGAQMLAYAFIAAGGDSDEEKEKEVNEWEEGNKLNAPDVYVHARGLLADYQLGDVNFMRKTGEDTYTYASTQRLETLPFANIWSASKRNDTDELVEIGLGYTSEVPTWLPFMTALANTPAAITEGFKESGPSQKAAGKGYWETGKAITPGMFKRVYNQIDTPTEFSPVEKIMNNTLFTVQTLDLKKEAGNLAADYTISVGRAMDNLRDDAKKEEAYEKVGINSVMDYTGTVEKKYTAYVKARKKVLDLKGLGKNEEWIRAQIKANPINDSLSKPELTSLMNGYFIMPDFDKVLTKKEEQQVKAVTTEIEKQRVRDLFKEYREQLNDQKALFAAFIKRDGEVVR